MATNVSLHLAQQLYQQAETLYQEHAGLQEQTDELLRAIPLNQDELYAKAEDVNESAYQLVNAIFQYKQRISELSLKLEGK